MPEGLFLSFEGGEGSGKSTQVARLEEWLRREGREVVVVREPGGTPLSEEIREVLLRPREEPVSPWAELCLYVAARAQLVQDVIVPSLERGAVVLADRYLDSSLVYQGVARGLGTQRVRTLIGWATSDLLPIRTFFFDVAPEVGLERSRRRGNMDRMESESLRFHQEVHDGYRDLAAMEPDRFVVLDASQSPDEIHSELIHRVRTLLDDH